MPKSKKRQSNVLGGDNAEAAGMPSPKKSKKMKHEKVDEDPPAVKVEPINDWSSEEQKILLDNMRTQLPKNDTTKYDTGANHLNWEAVQFADHNANDCRKQWDILRKKTRNFRTLTELVTDVQEHFAHQGELAAMPEPPKRPLTPFFAFFCEKRPRVHKCQPHLSTTEISKILSEKYKLLSDSKKQKYQDTYEKDKLAYQEKYQAYCAEHNIVAAGKFRGKKPILVAPATIYIDGHVEQRLQDDQSLLKPDLREEYRKKWNNLSDAKKLTYIRKALTLNKDYEAEMTTYCERNPTFRRPHKTSCISKDERKILDKADGKPGKPPSNGYGLFTSELITKLLHIPNKERMTEVARKWKELSDKEKDVYMQRSKEKKDQYNKTYQKYLDKLTPEERALIESAKKEKNSKEKSSSITTIGDKKSSKGTRKLWPGEPKKPVGSGYQLFSAELLSKLPNIQSNQRMGVIAKQWKGLSDKKRNAYNEKRDGMLQEYLQAIETYKQTLSPDELQKYIEMEKLKKPLKAKKIKETKVKKEDSDSDESDSSDSESSDSESSDSDSDDDSSSGSSSSDDDSDSSSDDSDSSSDDSDDDENIKKENGVENDNEKSKDVPPEQDSDSSSDDSSDDDSSSEESSDEE